MNIIHHGDLASPQSFIAAIMHMGATPARVRISLNRMG